MLPESSSYITNGVMLRNSRCIVFKQVAMTHYAVFSTYRG
jgi:hypothetical protein